MKNKIWKTTDAFRQLKTKIFIHTIMLVAVAAASIYLLYTVLLKGSFADWIVAVYQRVFGLEYDAARTLYMWTFRNYIECVFFIGVIVVFFIAFRLYLNRFTKYFEQINQGINNIGIESDGEVSLPPELSVTEKKINTIKHTLEKQKLDMKLAEQQKNDLIVYLAHDLKTPLASVIGYLNLLHDERQISEELKEKYLLVSLDKAQRLEDLIDEFFEIARYNLSKITLQYSKISLKRLLEMIIYEFQPIVCEKNININLRLAEDIVLKCDADKMQRVLDNLLRNAILYSFRGTDIDIMVITQNKNAVIRVTNHGNTIPKEKLERIFEQFYRVDVSRGTDSGGAGLGLAIAKQIVELHNGTITAKSEDEVVEFEVTLPVL